MKSSSLTCTAAEGLRPLTWNAFSQSAGASYGALAASFVPLNISVYQANGASYYGSWVYRFSIAAGVLPAWVKSGTALNIQASVTTGGVSRTLSDAYVVKEVDPDGLYFDVGAPLSSRDAVTITEALNTTALDNGAGNVTSPTVSLIMQCQKVMFSATAGTTVVAPAVDAGGNAPYSFEVASGGEEYEITAPPGHKFDLADWQVKQSGGAATISVRFI